MNNQKLKNKIIFIDVPKYHPGMSSLLEDALKFMAEFESFELITIEANYINLDNGHLVYKIKQELNPQKFVPIIYIQGWHYINGVKLLKDLRQDSSIQNIPIIVSSADDIEDFLTSQSVFYVSVPLCIQELIKVLSRAFELARLASNAHQN